MPSALAGRATQVKLLAPLGASRAVARSHAQDAAWRLSMASGVDRSEHPGNPLACCLACAKDRHPKGGHTPPLGGSVAALAAIEPGPQDAPQVQLEVEGLLNMVELALVQQEWYHGTDCKFAAWVFPPPQSRSKPELVIHSGVFLSTDRAYASSSGGDIHMCECSIAPAARVLDALRPSAEMESFRI